VLVARNVRDIETLLFVFDLTSYLLIMLVCLLKVNIVNFRYLSLEQLSKNNNTVKLSTSLLVIFIHTLYMDKEKESL
jgi:hypothetical protein